MFKARVIQELVKCLEAEFEHAKSASLDAADYATNEETRPESEWDTQNIEASYLAAGQASQAQELADEIKRVKGMMVELLTPKTTVTDGALVKCNVNGHTQTYFLAPAGGGETIHVDGEEITVVTPCSPIASQFFGHRVGDSFIMRNGEHGSISAIL